MIRKKLKILMEEKVGICMCAIWLLLLNFNVNIQRNKVWPCPCQIGMAMCHGLIRYPVPPKYNFVYLKKRNKEN